MGSRNVDRLSNMPEDVISHILSLMPTKFAVRTSILSKTWIHNWMSVTNLDFDDQHPFHDIRCFTQFVNRVLKCCKTSQVKLFRLHCLDFWVPESQVCKWIDKAVRLNICELDVKVIYLLSPHSFFTCKTLTKLSLHSDDKISGDYTWNYPSYVNLPCLKTIDICIFNKAFVNALNLIRGCPVLESLSLAVTFDAFNEGNYDLNIPTLKHMKLSIYSKLRGLNKVVLNVPKLEDLYIGSYMSTVFVMEDLSSLISVTLSDYNGSDLFWVEVLKGVSGAKSLTLNYDHNKPSDTPMPNFPYLKHLEYNACSSWDGFDWLSLHQMLENSPELEHLCITTDNHEDSCWIEPQSVPTCLLKNLRTMKTSNFKGCKSYLQFLEYLLGNAEVLKKLTITCYSLPLDEEMQLSAELLNLPKASRYCEVHFLGSRSHYTTNISEIEG